MAAFSYDAVKLLVYLAGHSNSDSLARSFPIAFSLAGASGPMSFDKDGNRKLQLEILVGHEGHFAPLNRAR